MNESRSEMPAYILIQFKPQFNFKSIITSLIPKWSRICGLVMSPQPIYVTFWILAAPVKDKRN